MSAKNYVTIWCDGKTDDGYDCGQFVEGDTAAEIRKQPRKGWLHGLPGGRDLCPNCVDQRHETTRWGDGSHVVIRPASTPEEGS